MTKSELRKIFRRRGASLTRTETAELSRQIADKLFGSVQLAGVGTLHCFILIEKFNEIDTSLIFDRVWSDFPSIRTAVPRINPSNGELENYLYDAQTPLIENRWGIREPVSGEMIAPSELDIVLVPLLCFDESGHRVGYGKGFYDKLLSICRPDCRKLGLSFFPPVLKITDTAPHDIQLDACITPERMFSFS
ncbi:MAG: 5-formyltetrahydrofolate cyclo-ligase [Pyrinomonadaceae bacterium]